MPRSRRTTHTPQLAPVEHGHLRAGGSDQLQPRADLDGLDFKDVRVARLDLTGGATISDCRFAGLTAEDLDLSTSRLTDTTLGQVDVPVVRANRGLWRDIEIATGRIGSLEAYESEWRRVHFIGCKLTYVNLRGSDLLDVAFTGCQIGELDLVQTKVTRVALQDTRVAQLDVQHSELKHVDLRGAELEDIHGVSRLRGAMITSTQLQLVAPLLANEIGIEVEG